MFSFQSHVFQEIRVTVWIKINLTLIVILFIGAVYFQNVYVQEKYGRLVLNEECPWCEESDRLTEITYIPFSANYARMVAPSDPEFISNLLWMRTAYYFGLNAVKSGRYEQLLGLLDLVTDLSPKWELPYLYAAILLPMEAGDVEGGLYMIDKGLVSFPESWELWFFKGYYLWKSYSDNTAASEAMRTASLIKGSPRYLASLSVTLLTDGVTERMEESYEEQALKTITDPTYKNILMKDEVSND